jgi:hypothetical protein
MESEAWSKRAVYHAEEREFELYDSVRVRTVRNRRLYSDYLKWTEQTDRITSDRYVTIITPADSIGVSRTLPRIRPAASSTSSMLTAWEATLMRPLCADGHPGEERE